MEESEEPQNDTGEEWLTEKREDVTRATQDLQITRITQTYIERKTNHEGGTIALMGVRLSISEEALSGDHVITMTVIRDADMHLPRRANSGRITPVIKLEPETLKLSKPARLTIPHSAIISESDRQSVIIFTGQSAEGESQKGKYTICL